MIKLVLLGICILAMVGCGLLPSNNVSEKVADATPMIHEVNTNVVEDEIQRTTDAIAKESIPTATASEDVANNGGRSLASFGECVAHYAQEIEYLPKQLPFNDQIINIAGNFDRESLGWMSIGLCLDYAPRPNIDDVSGKCIVQAMKWYADEYPESIHLATRVAATACQMD